VIFPLLVCYLARTEQVEVERAAILAVVLDEHMKFRKHVFDQRRVAVGMIGMPESEARRDRLRGRKVCDRSLRGTPRGWRVAVLPPG
jgi:hypothetical protein